MNENSPWVASMDAPDASSLAALRLVPGLEVAFLPPTVWLKGPDWSEPLAQACRLISGLRRFQVLPGNRLLPEGMRVPLGFLPMLSWRPLRDALPVALPTGVRSALDPDPAAIRWVRSAAVQEAGAILVDWPAWRAFGLSAAEVRLHPLRYAATRDGRVWIEGHPLPPLAGERFSLQDGVAIPGGWSCSPSIDVAVLRRWLGLAPGDTAIAAPAGTWDIVRSEQFVPAARRAIRLTAEVLTHG